MPHAHLIERTLVLVKPDGVKRSLSGEILSRFEKAGLKVVGMKMVWVDKGHVSKHYPDSRTELLTAMGEKSLKTYEKYGLDPIEILGTKEPAEIGKMINEWNRNFLSSGPVVAIVLEGIHAIDNVRMITGNTLQTFADPGSIRGDFAIDSPALANQQKRAVHNLVHASGNLAEAAYEIDLWFTPKELHDYKRSDEDVMFGS
ncbi:MAG: nucleoside-diphosphate kinase [Candidatus Kerfeldbacteria bacterium]|nr:nucleoside-diphosphate kinase [Candidatus Kerfeldbacteria bacterium]